ncbi:MAG: DUF4276 family protein [Akkermansiaceae bacterium]|nr:DUF4276 family protein [Akkermansiaceae bacterium]
MIVFLLEEASIKEVIGAMVKSLYPDWIEGLNWLALSFSGKSDLEKNIRKKMESWGYNQPTFIIVRDNDGGDCESVKAKLVGLATNHSGHDFKVRIVCQELEAWFIGDLDAVERAYPDSKAAALKGKAKYRDPDSVGNAADEIHKITGVVTKVDRAKQIAARLSLDEGINRSKSFEIMLRTLRSFAAS